MGDPCGHDVEAGQGGRGFRRPFLSSAHQIRPREAHSAQVLPLCALRVTLKRVGGLYRSPGPAHAEGWLEQSRDGRQLCNPYIHVHPKDQALAPELCRTHHDPER